MKKNKKFPDVSPDFVIEDNASLLHHFRTNVIPPLSDRQIQGTIKGIFVGYMFLQSNGLTNRKLLNTIEDVEKTTLLVKDLTVEGLLFFRTSYQKYIKALDRGTDPAKACKNILERDLKKLRGEK